MYKKDCKSKSLQPRRKMCHVKGTENSIKVSRKNFEIGSPRNRGVNLQNSEDYEMPYKIRILEEGLI